jgi:hypothetical protein
MLAHKLSPTARTCDEAVCKHVAPNLSFCSRNVGPDTLIRYSKMFVCDASARHVAAAISHDTVPSRRLQQAVGNSKQEAKHDVDSIYLREAQPSAGLIFASRPMHGGCFHTSATLRKHECSRLSETEGVLYPQGRVISSTV